MKSFIIITLLLISFSLWADKSQELRLAESIGKQLAIAEKEKQNTKLKSFSNYKEIKAFLKKNSCKGFKYKAYIIDKNVYLVANKGKNIIIGRHFSAGVVDNHVIIDELISSTNTCVNLGKKQPRIAAMTVTHLKPFPNEFHVMQNINKEMSLYVITETGMYPINDGIISFIEMDDN